MVGIDYSSVYDYFPYGQLFDLEMRKIPEGCGLVENENPWYFLARIFIKGRSPNPCYTSLRVTNLPLDRWGFRFKPIPNTKITAFEIYSGSFGNGVQVNANLDIPINLKGEGVNADVVKWLNCFKLGTSGNIKKVLTPAIVDDIQVELEGEFENVLSDLKNKKKLYNTENEIPEIKELIQVYIDYDDKKRSTSSESGAPIQITSVNEVVNPRLTLAKDTPKHNGVATLFFKAKASERLNSNPSLSVLIPEGRKIRNWVAAGRIERVMGSKFSDFQGNLYGYADLLKQYYVLNPVTGTTHRVNYYDASTTGIQGTNPFKVGDEYAIFYLSSSSYFPDIFVDLLTNPDGGLGGVMPRFDHIDFPSIVAARRFCIENELYWDGVITQQEPFATWASSQAASSLLIPSRINGRFGLVIEDPEQQPIAVFNDSNIIKGSYSCQTTPIEERSINQVDVTFTDGSQEIKPPKTISVMTRGVYKGNVSPLQESLNYPCITHQEQAEKVATVLLNSKRKQHTSINFQTAAQGLFLKPGDLIVVQHQSSNLLNELSGVILYKVEDASAAHCYKVSFNIPDHYPNNLSNLKATIFRLANGNLLKNLDIAVVKSDENIVGFDVEEASNLKEGDPLVITLEKMENSLYRVQSLSVNESGVVQVSAINWSPDLYKRSGLYYCSDSGCVAGVDPI